MNGQQPTIYRLPGFNDPFSAISHLLGAVFFLYLAALLLRRGRGDAYRLFLLGIYSTSCVLLLSMSGVYHMMVRGGLARRVMIRLDHGAIFLLIAGTFTPTHGLLFRGWRRWALISLIWIGAITGITLKTIFFNDLPEVLGMALYLGMGWVGGFSMVMLARRFGFTFIKPLVWGGLAYTIGALLDQFRWTVVVPGVIHSHELFHVAVLMGALFHWRFIWQFADGRYGPESQKLLPA